MRRLVSFAGVANGVMLLLMQILLGVKESDTGLAAPNLWDIPADKQRMQEEQPLQVRI